MENKIETIDDTFDSHFTRGNLADHLDAAFVDKLAILCASPVRKGVASTCECLWAWTDDGTSEMFGLSVPWFKGQTVNDVLRVMSKTYLDYCTEQSWTPRDSYVFSDYDFGSGHITFDT